MSVTSKYLFFAVCLSLLFISSVCLPGNIFAADLQGGNSVVDRNEQDSRNDFTIVDTNIPITGNGYLTNWSIYAKKTTKVQLKIIRKEGSDYKVIGQSDLVTPILGNNQFDLASPIYIKFGDLVGLYFEQGGVVPFTLDSGSYSRGDLNGKTLFTESGINPDLDQIVPFSDSSDRTYSVVVNGIVEYKVDDDSLDCPEAAYTTIQDALTAALPGETVQVCKGNYTGSIDVSKKGMTIVGLNSATETVVKAGNAGGKKYGFRLFADNVTIQNFTIRDADKENSVGIIIGANKIIDPTSKNSNNNVIAGNVFDNNNYSIYAWQSNKNVIKNNMIINGQNVSGVGVAVALVGNNNEISGNKFENNNSAVIFVKDSKSGKITNNQIIGSGAGQSQIELNGVTNSSIATNMLRKGGFGIRLSSTSSNNKINTNSLESCIIDGIRAEENTKNNTIQMNMIKKSGSFDAHDSTSGIKKGVKNKWIMNMCSTSSPVGLCFK